MSNTHIKNYIRKQIKGVDRFSYQSYTVKYSDLDFCFEFVGLYFINLLCDKTPMTYNLTNSFISCGCITNGECKHKDTLRDYFRSIVQ